MSIQFPLKKYFTFSEVMEELLCSADDLAHYIVNTNIVPSLFLRRAKYAPNEFELCTYEFAGREGLFPMPQFLSESGYPYLQGFFYLISPIQTNSNSCYFTYVSDKPREHIEGNVCFSLPNNLGLEVIFEEAVFMAEELERFKSRSKANSATALAEEKQLTRRERDTLLSIIAVLCKEAKLEYAKPAKTAGLIQSTAAGMGISIGETTIENHLKKIPNALATRTR